MKNTFKQEQGRSMVEMLGVLAIIGVLSVGGIAGYTSAMRQYRANEIVNATSMLYMMGASQNQGNGDKQMLYSAVLGTVPSGVSEITYNAGKTITLAFTDTDVCPLVKNKLGDKAAGDCPSLTVTFDNDSDVNTIEAIIEKIMKLEEKYEDLLNKKENLEDWYADNCVHNFCAPNCPTEEECENKKNEKEQLEKEIEKLEKEAEELKKGKEEIEDYLAIEEEYRTFLADGWDQADADEYKRLSQRILELQKQLDSDTSIPIAEQERLRNEIEDLQDAIAMLVDKYEPVDADPGKEA